MNRFDSSTGGGLLASDPLGATPSEFLSAWFHRMAELDCEARKQFKRYYAGYLRRFDLYMRYSYDRRLEPLLIYTSPGTRVLEVGSGCGSESLFLAACGCDVTGIELHKQRLHTSRQRLALLQETEGPLDCRFLEGSLFDDDIKLDPPYDVVWMEEVFHHLEPRDRVAGRLASLVRTGGHVVIADTNSLNPLVQLSLLRARGLPKIRTFTDDWGREHQYGVERVTSARRVARYFENNGFETELVRHERLFPNLGIAPKCLMAVERGLAFLPRCTFAHYSYVCRRKA